MEAEKFDNRKNTKKPESNIESSFDTNFNLIIQNTLQEVLGEVQSQLENVNINFKTSLLGIEKEIKEIKTLAEKNRHLLINLAGKSSIEEKEPELISTGFDILTKVPSHLRRTYKIMLTKEMGATASDVARETEKSRPLESDYLNQLFEKGLLKKKSDPDNNRRKIFIVKTQDNYKEEEENHNSFLNHDDLNNDDIEMIIQEKKLQKMRK
jgi:predicted transcriptional regulator